MRRARLAAWNVGRALRSAWRRALDFGIVTALPEGGVFSSQGVPVGRADAVERRPRLALTWPLRLVLAASLAVPLLVLAIAAWENYRLVQLEAERRVLSAAGELHEHAARAFETYRSVLSWIDDRIRGREWNRIEHDPELHDFLSDLEKLPQVGAVLVIDASGHIRASGQVLRTPLPDVSHLDAFAAQEQRDAGIFVGREQMAPLTPFPELCISRRRSSPNGSFEGVIIVCARSDYFGDFFSTISREKNFSASLLRNDGSVLVRYPPLSGPLLLSSAAPIMHARAAEPNRGLFRGQGGVDGVERLFAYQRIEGYPLYVVFGTPTRDILAWWRANLVNYLLFAIPASLGLFCMTLFAVRQLQRQQLASARWRSAAERLQREMNQRTGVEAELHQAQKMEALGQLTGGVAHDFNNLLTVLQGCLEMLSGRQRDARLQARVETALAAIERGEKLTGQLLAFARRQPLTVARVDVNELLRQMADLLSQTVGGNIRIASDLAPDLWAVDTDPTQLELAVINIAINARDAMQAGGQLRVRTFNTRLSGNDFAGGEEAEFAGLEISDTGAGMPPEVTARAFDPFFTTKEPGKGTGLGLSMVYGFARQSRGSASIRSEVGRGTVVTLLLPRSRE
jgi:two-component system NtrC family sensor kinase